MSNKQKKEYNPAVDGGITAIRIRGFNPPMALLAFANGGTVSIEWTDIEERQKYAPGINGYTYIYDERIQDLGMSFEQFVRQKGGKPEPKIEYTEEKWGLHTLREIGQKEQNEQKEKAEMKEQNSRGRMADIYVVGVIRVKAYGGKELTPEEQCWEYGAMDDQGSMATGYPCFSSFGIARKFNSEDKARSWWDSNKKWLTGRYNTDYDLDTVCIMKVSMSEVCRLD